MRTKREVMFEICDQLSIERVSTSRGSSVPKIFMERIAIRFGINSNLRSTEILKEILNDAGIDWEPSFDSASTPSGGGETITLNGLEALKDAVTILMSERRASDSSAMSGATMLGETDWTIIPGQSILRRELHDKYGGTRQGGISPSRTTSNIFLFFDSKEAETHGYMIDGWDSAENGVFHYSAEGQVGDQEMTRFNKSILEHSESGKSLRLFEGVRGVVKYIGEFELAAEKFKIKQDIGRDGVQRKAIAFVLKPKEVFTDDSSQTNIDRNLTKTELTGASYRWEVETMVGVELSEPFTNDPDALDRATFAHKVAQNSVAEWLCDAGLEPLSPNPHDPPFDVAWEMNGGLYVAEIKSINAQNENHQIRFAIGQVLEYCQLLNATPLIVVSEAPQRQNWSQVCALGGVHFFDVSQLSIIKPNSIPQRTISFTHS